MDLESELRALDLDWPSTPAPFELGPSVLPRRRRRWAIAAAGAAAAAVAAAFAVPQSRGALLRFLHLGAARVELVQTLPPAERRSLTADLGRPVPLAVARGLVPGLRLPPLDPPPPAYAEGEVVSFVFRSDGRPVLLNELPGGGSLYLKKLAAFGTSVEPVDLFDGGLWVTGREHVVTFPNRSPRLAGDVLVWLEGDTTFRLEGPGLAKADALRLARSLRRG